MWFEILTFDAGLAKSNFCADHWILFINLKLMVKQQNLFQLFVFSLLGMALCPVLRAQTDDDAHFIKAIFSNCLEHQTSYQWLEHLSEKIGHRLAGSPQSLKAIDYTHAVLDTLNTDKVWNQACTVRYWYRGASPEQVRLHKHLEHKSRHLKALALGGSGASPKNGVTAQVIEFKSLDEARAAGDAMKGKIVYFSRAFDQSHLRTFHAYGGAVDQRAFGPNVASKHGAVACVVRSMGSRIDDFPHTGSTIFEDGVKKIPAVALSTRDAEFLSSLLKQGPVSLNVKTSSEDRGLQTSYSVIGEIKGSEFPNEIILVGGHLDSWDVGGGAHDDGAGCVQSMEVFELFKRLNYKPKRTLRCVLFQNEENGTAGAKAYAEWSSQQKEFHLAAIESDAGGFTPHAFTYDADTSVLKLFTPSLGAWESLFEPYDIKFNKGGSGADVGYLKPQKGLLLGLSPDSQRYFEYHHTDADRITAVHPRELALGSAAMASLVYLIDQYGLNKQ